MYRCVQLIILTDIVSRELVESIIDEKQSDKPFNLDNELIMKQNY